MNVLIVTPDIVGPVRNGGIGTACTALAEALRRQGHDIRILYTEQRRRTDDPEDPEDEQWCHRYEKAGIEIVSLDEVEPRQNHAKTYPDHPNLALALRVHAWLEQQPEQVIIFVEWKGHGFVAAQAKQTGLSYRGKTFITWLHSPSRWHRIHSQEPLSGIPDLLTDHMEKAQTELSDVAVSPSRYLLDWCRDQGWKLPDLSRVIPNPLPELPGPISLPDHAEIRRLIFFGRLEERKGLRQFCQAIDRLLADTRTHEAAQNLEIVFLGKLGRMAEEHAALYLAQNTAKWPMCCRLWVNLDQPTALENLRSRPSLVVCPSNAENLPYTVYEALGLGLPVIARDSGGTAELFHPEDRAAWLTSDNPQDLAEKIALGLQPGLATPRLAFDPKSALASWQQVIEPSDALAQPSSTTTPPLPHISVCVTHFNRPHLLEQALNGIRDQDYTNFEVIVVDDASTDESAAAAYQNLAQRFDSPGWKFTRRKRNGYLGAARNAAARLASGEYLLFVDDDNVPKPNMLTQLARAAAHTAADLVGHHLSVFEGKAAPTAQRKPIERYAPLGAALDAGLFINAFGDASCLIRRSLFHQIGGFTEDYGKGHEDWEFFIRAIHADAKMIIVPQALLWYRRQPASMLSSTPFRLNMARVLRAYLHQNSPVDGIIEFAHAQSIFAAEANRRLDKSSPMTIARSLRDANDTALPILRRHLHLSPEIDYLNQVQADSNEAIQACLKIFATHQQADILESLAELVTVPQATMDFYQHLATAQWPDAHAAALLAASPSMRSDWVRLVLAAMANPRTDEEQSLYLSLLETRLSWITEDQGALLDYVAARVRYQQQARPETEERARWLLRHLETDYLSRNSDVKAAVHNGELGSGTDHYFDYGYDEGRIWPLGQAVLTLIREPS